MPKQVEKRLDDLEKKVIPEGEYQVIVNWDCDPKPPKDEKVRVIVWEDEQKTDLMP